jgi:hypothetical protein
VKRLNWGCGAHLGSGWINSDVKDEPGIDLVCDIRQGLPLETGSVDYAVSIHSLPELSYPEIVPVLEELRRVLVPGGTLRLAVPDLERGIDAFLGADDEYFQVDPAEVSSRGGRFAVHMLWYGYSRTLFTTDFALELLQKAGFRELSECSFGVTASGIEAIVELDNRERESFFVEGTAPHAGRRPTKPQRCWGPPGQGYNAAMPRQERIRVIDVSSESAGGLRKSHLDEPTIGAELESNALKIVGWAVGKEKPVELVEVLAGGEVVATSPLAIERPGVADAYKGAPNADRAGFRVVVQGSGEGRHELSVRGVLEGGERVPIGSIALEIQRRGLFARIFGN